MAKGKNQKLKLLYLKDILTEKTDEEHGLTVQEIIDELERYGVNAERKSIYSDFEALKTYGIDIIKKQTNKEHRYCAVGGDFEIAELKLLVDAVQSSKFITEKKSRQLIKKLEKYAGMYGAKQLHRQVYVQGRIKSMNESIFYNVDLIYYAIDKKVQIRFLYFRWNVDKKMVLRHNGDFYQISPWGLIWDDENYYMVGYDAKEKKNKHFRVDKMIKISVTDDAIEGEEHFKNMDMASYSGKRFRMYDGDVQTVKIKFENSLAGVVIDRFGMDVNMIPYDDGHFIASVEVAVSRQFLGWIMALGKGVKIIEPDSVAEKMKAELSELTDLYG